MGSKAAFEPVSVGLDPGLGNDTIGHEATPDSASGPAVNAAPTDVLASTDGLAPGGASLAHDAAAPTGADVAAPNGADVAAPNGADVAAPNGALSPSGFPRPNGGLTSNGAVQPDGTPQPNGTAQPNGFGQPNGTAPAGATAAQLRRFIKSRAYIPMHELRRRFAIDGGDDDVTAVEVASGRVFVGLPAREGRLLGELLRGGEVGYELSHDPASPIVIGLYPMRPVPRP